MRAGLVVMLLLVNAGCVALPDEPLAPAAASAAANGGFRWSSSNVTGDVSIRISFSLSDTSRCRGEAAVAGRLGPTSPVLVQLVEIEGETSWIAVGISEAVHAHAPPGVDSRGLFSSANGRYWSSAESVFEAPRGTFSVTLLGVRLEASDNPLTQGASVVVEVECDGHIRLVAAEGSHELVLRDLASSSGGAGGRVGTSTFSIGDRAATSIKSPSAFAVAGWTGAVAADLRVVSPSATEDWEVGFGDVLGFERLDGGRGKWSVDVDAGASALGGLWFALAGFEAHPTTDDLERALS